MSNSAPGWTHVHLNVPSALKARWVKASQARGLKLSDHLLDLIGRGERMRVFKITEAIASQYHGAGWAIAAIVGGEVVALRYLVDVAPEHVSQAVEEAGQHAAFMMRQWIGTAEAAPVVRELQALGGDVSAGMCSAWEFVEL